MQRQDRNGKLRNYIFLYKENFEKLKLINQTKKF